MRRSSTELQDDARGERPARTLTSVDDDWYPDPDRLPRVLTRAEALARGFTRQAIDRRLASRRWRRILPRTYLTVDSASEYDRYHAALGYAGGGAVLSGAAALRVAGFDRVRRPERTLVLVPPGNRIDSCRWVLVRASAREVRPHLWPGPCHADIARAAADHALSLRRLDDVRALVAMVVRDGRCTLDELEHELDAGPRNGSGFLRQALAEVGLGAASAPEARAACALRNAPDVPAFEQNVELRLPSGRRYVADFYWRVLRAVLEIDSVEYHLEAADWRATMDRHLDLTTIGLSVVHRPPSALRDEAGFVHGIATWLANRAIELGVRP